VAVDRSFTRAVGDAMFKPCHCERRHGAQQSHEDGTTTCLSSYSFTNTNSISSSSFSKLLGSVSKIWIVRSTAF